MSRHLATALVDDLRARIVGGRTPPGERPPRQSTPLTEHGVSRTVVRETVPRLRPEGLVHTRRGSGSIVPAPPAAPAGTSRRVRTLQDRHRLPAFRAGAGPGAAALGNDVGFHRTVVEADGGAPSTTAPGNG
ncbi:GntR family transcriptional regulator [Kocuria sp. M4R2S49]|uniref:GntR family transcriptional regulator n=1 Tax=Kocuria rhizosphaericola TaxID=3376284 RepID=UPI0037AB2033